MLRNLTPHAINMIDNNNNVVLVLESMGLARCLMTSEVVGNCEGFPVSENSYGEVTGLPAAEDGVTYIVSNIVAQAVKGKRNDCLVVNDTVRNEAGQIIGCRGFARV